MTLYLKFTSLNYKAYDNGDFLGIFDGYLNLTVLEKIASIAFAGAIITI